MKKLVLLIGTLLCCAAAYGRPQFIEPTYVLRGDLGYGAADVDGDWIVAMGYYRKNIDPNDPDWTFDIWQKVVVFHRNPAGQWQLVQTLADEYLIFNSDEHSPEPHDLALENGVAAFSTNSGLHIFELVSGTFVSRQIVGGPQSSPADLDFDGTTLLASDRSCTTAATSYTKAADGRWVASGDLVGIPACDEYFYPASSVSGTRALVLEDGPSTGTRNDSIRVFQRSGGAWQPGMTLAPPPTPNVFFPGAIALRGDVALIGGNVTSIYRRGASGFEYAGKIPLLTYFFDGQYARDVEIGPQFALQTYPGPSTANDVALLQPNASGGFDHVATLGTAYDQGSLHISGRRVVTVGGSSVFIYDLRSTFTPATSALQDFETGTAGWTPVLGQFARGQRGATYVYRQSNLVGDAVAVGSADLKTTLITADVRARTFGGSSSWVGLMARYVDENNHYYATIRANNSVSIRKKVKGVITDLVTYYPPVQAGKNYRVSFEVTGNHLKFYFGEYVLSAYDDQNSLLKGRAGVRTYGASADFDNVIVTPAPLQELGGGPYLSDLSYFDIIDGSWTTNSVFNIDQASTAGDARILHGPATDDQVLSVNARLNDIGTPDGSHWFGAMVRYTNPSNYYYLTLRSTNELSLRKLVNGVATELARVPFTVQAGKVYRLRFEAIGTKLLVYVNDDVQLQASDSSHTQGRSGLVTYRAATSFSKFTTVQP